MTELRGFILVLSVVVMVGIALDRLIGPSVEPAIGLVVVVVVSTGWREWRRKRAQLRRTLADLRQFEQEDRLRLAESIDSNELRTAVVSALGKENTERSDGVSETFPFPAVFRRRATVRYWRMLALSAVCPAIAAFVPDMGAIWRIVWLSGGVAAFVRSRKSQFSLLVAQSVIEINPYRISYLWPDGTRETISFADGARYEDSPDDQCFFVRSGEKAIMVSYHLVGVVRLEQLVEQYGAVMPAVVQAAD